MTNRISLDPPDDPIYDLARRIMKMQMERLEMLAAAFLKETSLPASEVELVQHPAGLTERIFFFRQRQPLKGPWPDEIVGHLHTIRRRCEVLGDTLGFSPQTGPLVNDIAFLLLVLGGEFEPQNARAVLGSAAPPALVFAPQKPK